MLTTRQLLESDIYMNWIEKIDQRDELAVIIHFSHCAVVVVVFKRKRNTVFLIFLFSFRIFDCKLYWFDVWVALSSNWYLKVDLIECVYNWHLISSFLKHLILLEIFLNFIFPLDRRPRTYLYNYIYFSKIQNNSTIDSTTNKTWL